MSQDVPNRAPREFLERMTFVDVNPDGEGPAATLEALFHTPLNQTDDDERVAPVLLLPGVPALGGTMDHAVMAELSWATSQLGAATLRINHAGVGASSRNPAQHVWLSPDDIDDDVLQARVTDAARGASAALDQLRSTVGAVPVVVIGFSFGALVAIAIAQQRPDAVERVVVVGPPMLFPSWNPTAIEALECDVDILLSPTDPLSSEAAIEAAKDAGLWPATIEDADPNFVRGLSELGKQVVRRAFGV